MAEEKKTTTAVLKVPPQPVTQGRIVLIRLPDAYEERPRLRPAICTRVHKDSNGLAGDFSVFLAPGDTDVTGGPIFMARGFKFGEPIPTGQKDANEKDVLEIAVKCWKWPPRA